MATSVTLTTSDAATTSVTLTANNASTEYTLLTGSRGPAGATGATGPAGADGTAATVDATVIDGSTNAVSGNAVFDSLALKSPLADPTFTGEVVINTLVGVNKDSLTISNTSDGDGQQSYGIKINKSGVDSFGLDVYVGPNVENGVGVYSSVSGEASTGLVSVANGVSSKGAAIYSSGNETNGLTVTSSGTYSTGIVVESSGTENVGMLINSTVGDYQAKFSDAGTSKSFVARLNGAFGWFRGAFTGRIQAADTLTEDRTYTLPNDTGTVALINPSSGTQTFSGAQSFSSTTRPTSSGTGPPVETSLMTRDDAATHAYFSRRLFGNCSGTTGGGGSGATSRRTPAAGLIDGDLSTSTTSGAFYKINIASGVSSSSLMGIATSGSVNLSAKWSMFFRIAAQMGNNSHIYLCIGADGVSGIPSSGTSVGMEITSATVARLFRCNAGAAVYSSNATISGITTTTSTTDLFFWVENSGTGTLSLFFAPKLFSASMPAKPATAIATLAGVASGFTGSDVAIYLRATAASPSVFTGLTMRDVVFTEY